jgi:hypothetical protein
MATFITCLGLQLMKPADCATLLAGVVSFIYAYIGIAIGSGSAIMLACFVIYTAMRMRKGKAGSRTGWSSFWSDLGCFHFHSTMGWQPLTTEESEWNTGSKVGKEGIYSRTTELASESVRTLPAGSGDSPSAFDGDVGGPGAPADRCWPAVLHSTVFSSPGVVPARIVVNMRKTYGEKLASFAAAHITRVFAA